MITLDGSSGGGQMLRTALALSALTRRPFKIDKIRSTRPNSGLNQQLLTAISVMKSLCDAYVDGDVLGSTTLLFYPRDLALKSVIEIDVGTAASLPLLLQSLLPLFVFTQKVHLILQGGTDVAWSTSYDYFAHVVCPALSPLAKLEPKLIQRGYYPKGQGKMELLITPREGALVAFDKCERGTIQSISGVSHASFSHKLDAQRQAMTAQFLLKDLAPAHIRESLHESASEGIGLTLFATFEDPTTRVGVCILSDQPETSAKHAAMLLKEQLASGAPVDVHLADHLIPYLGKALGRMRVSALSEHTKNNILVTEAFLSVRFHIEGNLITAEPIESQS